MDKGFDPSDESIWELINNHISTCNSIIKHIVSAGMEPFSLNVYADKTDNEISSKEAISLFLGLEFWLKKCFDQLVMLSNIMNILF